MHFLSSDSILNLKKNTLLKDSRILVFRSRYCFIPILQRKEVKHEEVKWLAQGHSCKNQNFKPGAFYKKYCVDFCPEVILLKDGGY